MNEATQQNLDRAIDHANRAVAQSIQYARTSAEMEGAALVVKPIVLELVEDETAAMTWGFSLDYSATPGSVQIEATK